MKPTSAAVLVLSVVPLWSCTPSVSGRPADDTTAAIATDTTPAEDTEVAVDTDVDTPEAADSACIDDTAAPMLVNYSVLWQSIQLPGSDCKTLYATYAIDRRYWQAWFDDPATCGEPHDCDDMPLAGTGGVVADDGAVLWLMRSCEGSVIDPNFLNDQGEIRFAYYEPPICAGG